MSCPNPLSELVQKKNYLADIFVTKAAPRNISSEGSVETPVNITLGLPLNFGSVPNNPWKDEMSRDTSVSEVGNAARSLSLLAFRKARNATDSWM